MQAGVTIQKKRSLAALNENSGRKESFSFQMSNIAQLRDRERLYAWGEIIAGGKLFLSSICLRSESHSVPLKTGSWVPRFIDCSKRAVMPCTLSRCDVAGLEPFGAARIGTKVSPSAEGSLKASQALPLFAHFIIACTPTAVCECVCVRPFPSAGTRALSSAEVGLFFCLP